MSPKILTQCQSQVLFVSNDLGPPFQACPLILVEQRSFPNQCLQVKVAVNLKSDMLSQSFLFLPFRLCEPLGRLSFLLILLVCSYVCELHNSQSSDDRLNQIINYLSNLE